MPRKDSDYDFMTVSAKPKRKPIRQWKLYIPKVGCFPRMSRPKSLYALLVTAAACDRRIDDLELHEIFSLAERTRTLRPLPRHKLQKMHEQIEPKLKESEKVLALAEFAARAFRHKHDDERGAVFMQALEVLFSDRVLTESERQFTKELAAWLRLKEQDAIDYVNVMRAKNAH